MNYNKKPDFGLALFMIAFLAVAAFGVITYKKPEQVQAYYETGSNYYLTNANDKVKIFTDKNYKDLEAELNEFIQNNIVIDVEYGVGGEHLNTYYSALVYYKEKK